MTSLNTIKTALGVLALGGLLAAAAAGIWADRPGGPPDRAAAAGPAEKTGPPARPPAAGAVRVVVLDPQGRPLPGAKVHAGIWTGADRPAAGRDFETDAEGAVRVSLPETVTILRLWAGKKPFVTLFACWEPADLAAGAYIPAEYTFRLEAAVTAGGRVLNEMGRPVAGARVGVRLLNDPEPVWGDGRTRYNFALADGDDAATTDAEGRWRVDNVPDHPVADLSVLATHPDYVTDGAERPPKGMLRAGTAALTVRSGIVVRGVVTDPAGRPVKGAVVVNSHGNVNPSYFAERPTDAAGRYRLPAMAPGRAALAVVAPGYAPRMRAVDVRADLPPQDFRLGPGKPVRLRVVDAAGKLIPGAAFSLQEWRGDVSIGWAHNQNPAGTGIPDRADTAGRWAWLSAPDEPVVVRVSAPGFAPLEVHVLGGVSDRAVVLKAEHRITGTVTDAATGELIPAFTVVPVDVSGSDVLNADWEHAVVGRGGKLEFLVTRPDGVPLRLRVEAPGYRTQHGPGFRAGDDTPRRQDFHLQPADR